MVADPTAVLQVMIDEAPWVKSKKGGPHEYILYKQGILLYRGIQALLKTHAVRRKFGGSTYRYLNLNGWRYWLMYPIINRAEGELEDEL